MVGLPGSGKTHLAHSWPQVHVIDDIHSVDELPLPHTVDHLVICDPWFCMTLVRHQAEHVLRMRYDVAPEWIYFENDPVQCRMNVLVRDDGRQVMELIRNLSQHYEIPSHVLPMPVWSNSQKC